MGFEYNSLQTSLILPRRNRSRYSIKACGYIMRSPKFCQSSSLKSAPHGGAGMKRRATLELYRYGNVGMSFLSQPVDHHDLGGIRKWFIETEKAKSFFSAGFLQDIIIFPLSPFSYAGTYLVPLASLERLLPAPC